MYFRLFLLSAILFLTGCSIPSVQFTPIPNEALSNNSMCHYIVIQDKIFKYDYNINLVREGIAVVGSTLPGTYLKWDSKPGINKLYFISTVDSIGVNHAVNMLMSIKYVHACSLIVNGQPGKTYYFLAKSLGNKLSLDKIDEQLSRDLISNSIPPRKGDLQNIENIPFDITRIFPININQSSLEEVKYSSEFINDNFQSLKTPSGGLLIIEPPLYLHALDGMLTMVKGFIQVEAGNHLLRLGYFDPYTSDCNILNDSIKINEKEIVEIKPDSTQKNKSTQWKYTFERFKEKSIYDVEK